MFRDVRCLTCSWRESELIRSIVFSPALTSAAAQLLGVKKLRLYQVHLGPELSLVYDSVMHVPGIKSGNMPTALRPLIPALAWLQDCLFLKEPGYSLTNWHSDLRQVAPGTLLPCNRVPGNALMPSWSVGGHLLTHAFPLKQDPNVIPVSYHFACVPYRMAPFDTNGFLTAWIPLRPVHGPSPGPPSSPATEAPAGRKQATGRGGNVYDELEQDSGMLFASGSHRDFAAPVSVGTNPKQQ
jgi:hypothetical protein